MAGRAGCEGLLDVQVQESGEYALAEFETQDDAVYAFHLLAAKHAGAAQGEWILDFQHIDVRHRLRRHFQLYCQLLGRQAEALRSLEDAWSGGVAQRQEPGAAQDGPHVDPDGYPGQIPSRNHGAAAPGPSPTSEASTPASATFGLTARALATDLAGVEASYFHHSRPRRRQVTSQARRARRSHRD
eukprot:1177409-Rhodomonas_salina.1